MPSSVHDESLGDPQGSPSVAASGAASEGLSYQEEPVGSLADVVSELRRGTLGPADAISRLRILTVFSDATDLLRITCLMDDLRKELATAVPVGEQGAQAKAVGALAGLPMGGEKSATWRAARRMTTFTLHLTSPETAHTIKWDPSSGAQVADIPATRAISDPFVFMCIFLHFRHAALEAQLMTEEDLHELGTFVAEKMYTRSKTEAIEGTVRKLLYTLDVDTSGTLTLASLVMTRAPMELQAEECRYAALAVSKGRSSSQGSGAGSKPSGQSRAKGSAKGETSGACFNWSKGLNCAPSSLRKDGTCRFEHVCGFDLGGGNYCKEPHKRAACPHHA
jgi:hypothetical protein